MTLEKVKSKLRRDIAKLKKEQAEEVAKCDRSKPNKQPNDHLIAYIITRKKTLQEVLNMLP